MKRTFSQASLDTFRGFQGVKERLDDTQQQQNPHLLDIPLDIYVDELSRHLDNDDIMLLFSSACKYWNSIALRMIKRISYAEARTIPRIILNQCANLTYLDLRNRDQQGNRIGIYMLPKLETLRAPRFMNMFELLGCQSLTYLNLRYKVTPSTFEQWPILPNVTRLELSRTMPKTEKDWRAFPVLRYLMVRMSDDIVLYVPHTVTTLYMGLNMVNVTLEGHITQLVDLRLNSVDSITNNRSTNPWQQKRRPMNMFPNLRTLVVYNGVGIILDLTQNIQLECLQTWIHGRIDGLQNLTNLTSLILPFEKNVEYNISCLQALRRVCIWWDIPRGIETLPCLESIIFHGVSWTLDMTKCTSLRNINIPEISHDDSCNQRLFLPHVTIDTRIHVISELEDTWIYFNHC
jgi:hypothetical protein